ncbi:MAG: PQQ-binding-like beta-propeller repeat protein [Verrucomicrobiota bacterium]
MAQEPTNPVVIEEHPWKKAARQIAIATGLYCTLVVAVLIFNLARSRAVDPINNQQLADLKAALVKAPNDESLKLKIRALDLKLREQHLGYLGLVWRSSWMLFGGALVLLPALHYLTWRKKLPRPGKYVANPAGAEVDDLRSSYAVGTVTITGIVAVAYFVTTSPSLLSGALTAKAHGTGKSGATNAAGVAAKPIEQVAWPTADEFKKNWHRFRGFGGAGVATFTNVPLTWNGQSGENIQWKSPVPLASPSSPLIWGNRVFIAGATSSRRELYCYDLASGKLTWQKTVGTPGAAVKKEEESELRSFGCSTPATDGTRVFTIYDNCEVTAFDFEGNVVWSKPTGKPDNSYGHATSLEVHQGKVLVQIDQGDGETGNGKSRIFAFDVATGNLVWQTPVRPVGSSWATLIIIPTAAGKEQIIASGNPWLMAYDPANGGELWRAKVLGGEVTPSPVFGAGMVLSANEKLSAVKPDGSGDVTKSHVAWHGEDNIPDICSPLTDGTRVYLATSSGLITCYQAATGKKLWEKELEVECKTSPSLVGDALMLLGEKGAMVLLQAGDTTREISRQTLDDEFVASPAFTDGRIILRGKKSLFCIGRK